jgi:hypothetical protein
VAGPEMPISVSVRPPAARYLVSRAAVLYVGTSLARDHHAFLPHSKRPARLRGRLTAELRAGWTGAPLRVCVHGDGRNPGQLEYHPDGANLPRSSPPRLGNAPVRPIQRWLCRIRGSCERRLPTSDGLRAVQQTSPATFSEQTANFCHLEECRWGIGPAIYGRRVEEFRRGI